jgi:competence protein ComEC
MRTGMMALALGLLTLRFLPVLPPVWLWLVLPVMGLMVLPFRTYPLAFFSVRIQLGGRERTVGAG